MTEFVLIFQTPLGSDILCEWPLRQVDLRNGKGESDLQSSCNKVVVRGAWIVVPLVVPFFGICVYLTSYSWKYYYQCSLAVPKSKIFFPPLAHIPRVKTLFHSSKISTDRKFSENVIVKSWKFSTSNFFPTENLFRPIEFYKIPLKAVFH
jgi:hypothetical protein